MQKYLLPTFLLAVLALLAFLITPRERRFVKPADNGLWRACISRYRWDGVATGCSSPISLGDAEWLTRTRNGTKDAHGFPSFER